jgi:hypothetical protein
MDLSRLAADCGRVADRHSFPLPLLPTGNSYARGRQRSTSPTEHGPAGRVRPIARQTHVAASVESAPDRRIKGDYRARLIVHQMRSAFGKLTELVGLLFCQGNVNSQPTVAATIPNVPFQILPRGMRALGNLCVVGHGNSTSSYAAVGLLSAVVRQSPDDSVIVDGTRPPDWRVRA